jgi:hypothetical protein
MGAVVDERVGQGNDRSSRVGAVLVVLVLALVVAGLAFWFGSSMLGGEAVAQCGGSTMSPGDQCRNLRSGSISSYSDELSGQRSARNFFGVVGIIVGIGALCVGSVLARLAWTVEVPPVPERRVR